MCSKILIQKAGAFSSTEEAVFLYIWMLSMHRNTASSVLDIVVYPDVIIVYKEEPLEAEEVVAFDALTGMYEVTR